MTNSEKISPAPIVKQLKFGRFTWDEENKVFTLETLDHDENVTGKLQLNKVYAFAFMRFVVRMAQRNWFRKRK